MITRKTKVANVGLFQQGTLNRVYILNEKEKTEDRYLCKIGTDQVDERREIKLTKGGYRVPLLVFLFRRKDAGKN